MDENLVVIRMKVRKFEKSVVVRKLRLLPRCMQAGDSALVERQHEKKNILE